MRIAFLSFYSGKIDRGVEVATAVLASKISENHQIDLFQAGQRNVFDLVNTIKFNVESKWPQDTSYSWWRNIYLDHYSLIILLFTLKFIPYFIKNKYDLVIPTNGGWQVLIIRLLTWAWGKKMIIQGNAGIGHDDRWQLLCKPDVYIAISPQGFLWARKIAPKLNIQYIPYGVDIDLFKKATKIQLPLLHPIILCVSALLKYKRVDLLIKATAKIENANLLVIGHGPMQSIIIKMGKELLDDRFLLLNNVNHDELIRYYKSADIFSLPSDSQEAFGIVYIEAMAAGLPVVATNDYNRQEIIGQAGILVNPNDINAYAQALQTCLATDFGNKPMQQAEKFTWNEIVDKYLKVIAHL